MATLRELIIKVSANSTSFQSEISRASRMGADYYKTMEQGGRRASAAIRQQQQALSALNAEFASVKAMAAGMTGAVAGAFAVGSLIQTADNWGQLASRIKIATDSVDQYNLVQSRLMEISDRTYKPIEEQAELFIRSSTAMKELGYSTESTIDFIDSISSALTINAASADKGASAINALSKSMVLGKVSGGEWHTVMEVMPTVIGDVARYLGITETAVKKLASEGKLSMQTFSDALINAKNRNGELADSMPNTVADAMTKLSNHWKKYIGEVNEANGATQVFVTGLNNVSQNLGAFTTAGTALIGVGVARYLGNMARSTGSATAALVSAKKEQIAFAVAQKDATTVARAAAQADVYQAQKALVAAGTTEARAAQQARLTAAQTTYTASQARLQTALTSGTAAEITRAKAALSRAQAAVVAAKNADAQVLAERRLATAQARAGNARTAQSAANASLNSATSVIGMAGRGAAGLLSLVGGIPGALMIGAGAWYYMNQQTEQARKAAQEYASQIDEIKNKTASMSLPELDKNRGDSIAALQEQKRLIEEQEVSVNKLKKQIDDLNSARSAPGINSANDINILKAIEIVTGNLAVEENKLNQLREKSTDIQQVLNKIERERDDQIRAQAAEKNRAYQSLIRMNGAYDLINKTLITGNSLLAQRAALVNAPVRLPQATVSDADQMKLLQKQRSAQLSGLDGEARVKLQVRFDLEDMGRTGLDNTKYAEQYEAAALKEFRASESRSASQKAASAAASALKSEQAAGARVAEQYASKMDDLGIAIEVQKVRAEQGQRAAELFAASHESGTKWTDEQRRAIEASSVELARWSQKADEATRKQHEMENALKGLRDAARKFADESQAYDATRGMSSREKSKFDEEQQVDRVFDKTDKGAQAIAARTEALAALDDKYKRLAAAEADWLSGASVGFKEWADEASDYSGQMANAAHSAMGSLSDSMVDMLNGNKNSWKDWSLSVLEMIEKVLVNMALVSGLKSLGGAFGGGFGNFISGAVTANAKGGVYASSDLSAYSGQIVSSPTMFAFAKGAGLMGEAGPEAIMPLTRSADGSLGVRAVGGSGSGGGGAAPNVYITISSDGSASSQSATGFEQFGQRIGQMIQQEYARLRERDLRPGGAIRRAIKGQ